MIEIEERYFRPAEVDFLRADNTKARRELQWEPRILFDELVEIMVDYDMDKAGLISPGRGIIVSNEKGFGYTEHTCVLESNRS